MIDICFGYCLFGMLEVVQKKLHSKDVLTLSMNLPYESIDGDIIKTQARREANTLWYFYKDLTEPEVQEHYEELLEEIQTAHQKLKTHFENGETFRLWINNNERDRCGLYWFCDFAKDYTNTISIVMCPGYEYIPYLRASHVKSDWALFGDPDSVAAFAPTAHVLNEHEKSAYAREWSLLVQENAPLRILIDNTIVGVDDSFFDNIILGFVTAEPQPQNTVMGKMLGKWQGCVDVAFISMRIEHLIANGKIKVCEEKVDEHDCYWARTIALV